MDGALNFLVVEDDPIDAKAVCRLLNQSGMANHADSASSLEQAKEKVRHRRYDAVILDLGLPDSQGIDGVIEFQASAPELPIVVLTGCDDEKTTLRSMGSGAEDYLSKESLSEASLSRSLRYAIERHRRRHETYRDADSLKNSLHDALQQANTDPLTSLPNRQGLALHLEQLSRGRPEGSFLLGLADINQFKAINDAHGLHMGDAVLREFASRLQHCLREGDFAARSGGDEFVLVFSQLERGKAADLARKMLEHATLVPASWGGKSLPFSATMALCEMEAPFVDLEPMLEQARALLARGRQEGKNQVSLSWTATGAGERGGKPPSQPPFGDDGPPMRAWKVEPFGGGPLLAHYLEFGTPGEAERFRQAGRLSQMTMQCLRRAQAWRRREAPESELHLDLEADAVKPWLQAELLRLFSGPEERAATVFFVDSDFSGFPGQSQLAELRRLQAAGFRLGVREVGGGATILEHLLYLAPAWLRFAPATTINAGRYKQKSAALARTLAMLKPLKAGCLLHGNTQPDDLRQAAALGFSGASFPLS
jgi:two-component system cell cycle response regulator